MVKKLLEHEVSTLKDAATVASRSAEEADATAQAQLAALRVECKASRQAQETATEEA